MGLGLLGTPGPTLNLRKIEWSEVCRMGSEAKPIIRGSLIAMGFAFALPILRGNYHRSMVPVRRIFFCNSMMP